MNGLEELFALGNISGTATVKSHTFHMALLDSKSLQQSLNASVQLDPTAQALEQKMQILARALTNIDGNPTRANDDKSTLDEINALLKILYRLSPTIINEIFDVYDKLSENVSKELDADIKK